MADKPCDAFVQYAITWLIH